jgi:predicted dehydrogenase
MLARERIDGVVVAVPQYLHAQVSIDALDAGCHTFCEKPMALTVAHCDTMLAASRRSGKALMIGQVLQYIGPYRYVLERVRSGEFGRAVAMRTIRTQGPHWGSWGRPWRCRYEQCGGLLPEVSVHEIDLMLRIMGTPVRVSAAGSRYVNREVDYEDFVTAHVTFANGGTGTLTSGCCDYLGKHSAEIYLEKGTIYYDSITQQVLVAGEDTPRETLDYNAIHPEWESGTYREMREFIETCQGLHPATIPGEEGLRALEVAQACYISLRERRTIDLPLPRS